MFTHPFNWAKGDGALIHRHPQYAYWRCPNAIEMSVISCALAVICLPLWYSRQHFMSFPRYVHLCPRCVCESSAHSIFCLLLLSCLAIDAVLDQHNDYQTLAKQGWAWRVRGVCIGAAMCSAEQHLQRMYLAKLRTFHSQASHWSSNQHEAGAGGGGLPVFRVRMGCSMEGMAC